jgi:hypothetical protein
MSTDTLSPAVAWASAAFALPRPRAARLIMAVRQSVNNATGHGNRAAKRAAAIETSAWFDAQGGLTEADVDQLAARYAEEQGARRLFPHASSFHD